MATGFSAGVDLTLLKTLTGFISGGQALPTVIGISLHTTVIGAARVITGEWPTAGTTPTYARINAGVGTSFWTPQTFSQSTGITLLNATALNFNAFTVLPGGQQNLAAIGFNDNLTVGAGNLLWFADVSPQTVSTGIIVQFNIGDIANALL